MIEDFAQSGTGVLMVDDFRSIMQLLTRGELVDGVDDDNE